MKRERLKKKKEKLLEKCKNKRKQFLVGEQFFFVFFISLFKCFFSFFFPFSYSHSHHSYTFFFSYTTSLSFLTNGGPCVLVLPKCPALVCPYF